METRGRGIKVICHLILRSTWGFLLTSSLPGVCPWFARRSDWFSSHFSFSFKGEYDGAVQSEGEPRRLTDSCSSPYTLLGVNCVMLGCISCGQCYDSALCIVNRSPGAQEGPLGGA